MSKLTMRCRITGGKEIQRKLSLLPREIAAGPMRDVTVMGGDMLKGYAVANATAIKKTGTLAGDIHAELDKKETVGVRVTVKVGPGKKGWYGRLVERGHKIKWGRTFCDADTGKRHRVVYEEKDAEVYLSSPDAAWDRVAADLSKAKPKNAPDHLFSEQATGEPNEPSAKPLNFSAIYSARRGAKQ